MPALKYFRLALSKALMFFFISSFPYLALTSECQPWQWESLEPRGEPDSGRISGPWTPTFERGAAPTPGGINCRYWRRTYAEVNYYSCKKMADQAKIDVDYFFFLNPILKNDCDNMKPWHLYCTEGCKFDKRC